MDAFAVAVCKGLAMPEMSWKNAGIVGLYFGGFQGLMPFLGYLLGSKFSGTIESYDHWMRPCASGSYRRKYDKGSL